MRKCVSFKYGFKRIWSSAIRVLLPALLLPIPLEQRGLSQVVKRISEQSIESRLKKNKAVQELDRVQSDCDSDEATRTVFNLVIYCLIQGGTV